MCGGNVDCTHIGAAVGEDGIQMDYTIGLEDGGKTDYANIGHQ